jgi:hypothetical protein
MLNYDRLYGFRFRDVDQSARQDVWNVIAQDIYGRMERPAIVLDPAAGRCEFMNAIPAQERWIIDHFDHADVRDPQIHAIIEDVFTADIPQKYFEGVFVSNFLEHLPSPDDIARFLATMHAAMVTGGRIAVMGPNFKYCAREYFDCADHVLALTHVSAEEHLFAAGFTIGSVQPRYLPFSFRGHLPASPALTARYLKTPVLQRLLGKQFLIVATKGP